MKKTFALLLSLALLLSACLFTPAHAGEYTGYIGTITNTTPFFIYTNYSAGGVWGYVEIPENVGPCWVRVSMLMQGHGWVTAVVPVENSEFCAPIQGQAVWVILELVDRQDVGEWAGGYGGYYVYDARSFSGLAYNRHE